MYLPINPMFSTTTLPWLRLLLFFGLLLPTMALGSRLEMRQDTLPSQTVQNPAPPVETNSKPLKKKTYPLAIVALGISFLTIGSLAVFPNLALLIAGGALAIVTGIISIDKIKRQKEKLKGEGPALGALVLGLLIFGLSLLVQLFLWDMN
jgi:hypothetical protein